MTDTTDISPWEEYTGTDAGASYTKMKEIRLCSKLSSKALDADIPIGHFYLMDTTPDEPVLTDLGPKISVSILWNTQRLEYYDNGQYETYSTEYKALSSPIILFSRPHDNTEEIVAVAPYKNDIDPKMSMMYLKSDEGPHSKLRVRYILYCLWKQTGAENPEVVKINITAVDNTGCEKDAYKPLGFQKYAKNSFMGLLSAAKDANEGKIGLQFLYNTTISSEQVTGKNYVKTFELGTKVKNTEVIKESLEFTKEHLVARYIRKISKAWDNTIKKDGLPSDLIEYLAKNPLPMLGYTKMPSDAPKLASGVSGEKMISSADSVEFVADSLAGEDNDPK